MDRECNWELEAILDSEDSAEREIDHALKNTFPGFRCYCEVGLGIYKRGNTLDIYTKDFIFVENDVESDFLYHAENALSSEDYDFEFNEINFHYVGE